MQNLLRDLTELLSKDDRLVSEGKLLKNKVVELALKMDAALIKHLLKSKPLKKHFFTDIDGIFVFDKIKFQKFVSNKEFLPDSYTAFKNKIGLVSEAGDYLSESKEVVLAWPYKDCVLEGGQTKEDQKRNEIFWNETLAPDEIDRLLAPKVLTNFKKYDTNGEHHLKGKEEIAFSKENLIIKGNNLLALHSLYKLFPRKVKLIYIDPPYNTGSDEFGYNDNFNHSAWLSFMKDRLRIAKELLSAEGVIFIQCDDNEQAYLKVLCDEIFKKENFINTIAVKMSEATSVKMAHATKRFPKLKEYLLFYKKDYFPGFYEIDKYKHPVWDNENNILLENLTLEERKHLIELEEKENNNEGDVKLANNILKKIKKHSLQRKIKELKFSSYEDELNWKFDNAYRIIKTAGASGLASIIKRLDVIPKQDIAAHLSKENVLFFYLTDFNTETKDPRFRVIFADSNLYKNPCDFWQDIKTSGAIAEEGGVKLEKGKKPEKLIERIIKMTTQTRDVVLDFHLGSGTTCAVAHKMGRRYIGVEQLDYGKNDSIKRLRNVIEGDNTGISSLYNWQGGGSFIYCELMQHNEAYIDRIREAKKAKDLLTIWNEMQDKAFISYKVDVKAINENISDFEKLNLDEQKRFLVEILDKNQLYVNYSEIDDKEYGVSEPDKKLNRKFYGAA